MLHIYPTEAILQVENKSMKTWKQSINASVWASADNRQVISELESETATWNASFEVISAVRQHNKQYMKTNGKKGKIANDNYQNNILINSREARWVIQGIAEVEQIFESYECRSAWLRENFAVSNDENKKNFQAV